LGSSLVELVDGSVLDGDLVDDCMCAVDACSTSDDDRRLGDTPILPGSRRQSSRSALRGNPIKSACS
jgi:hypothetical protein